MTAGTLLSLLEDVPFEYHSGFLVYSPAPGVNLYVTNYHTEVAGGAVQFILLVLDQLNGFAIPVLVFIDRLIANPQLLPFPVYIPTLLIPTEVTGIRLIPAAADSTDFPLVGLEGFWTPARPPFDPRIPFDQRKSRGRLPSWPNIPVADP